MKFVLDTNICIYWLKGNKEIEDKTVGVGLDKIAITVITECELAYGAYKSTRIQKNLNILRRLKREIATLHTSNAVAEKFGQIKAHLEKIGKIIDDADILIASITLFYGGILVTNNISHFERIPGLKTENWLKL